ncbi:universal stress protein [Actinomycetota bacterium Odt1-20B]
MSCRTVTAGIDGSRESLDAADWAAREAELRDLPLRLLHAGTEADAPTHLPEVDVPAERARTALDRAALQLSYAHPALKIVARRIDDPPIPALLQAAAESEALVLGSRGFTAFAGFMVGSVALAVASRAEHPVVLVRAGERPEDERLPYTDTAPLHRTPYRQVLLGLDLDHPSDELIAYAFDAAAHRHASLHVLHARTLPPLAGSYPAVPSLLPDEEDLRMAKSQALTATLQPWRHKYPDTPVTEKIVHGHPGHHLIKAATGAGLLVIGRRRTTGPHLGHTAHSAIHHVTCPIAVVSHD